MKSKWDKMNDTTQKVFKKYGESLGYALFVKASKKGVLAYTKYCRTHKTHDGTLLAKYQTDEMEKALQQGDAYLLNGDRNSNRDKARALVGLFRYDTPAKTVFAGLEQELRAIALDGNDKLARDAKRKKVNETWGVFLTMLYGGLLMPCLSDGWEPALKAVKTFKLFEKGSFVEAMQTMLK